MKRYYWAKIDITFFDRKEVKKLRSVSDKYVIIYLELLLAAANTEGYLRYEGIEDDIFGEIALTLNEKRDDVKAVCLFLERLNLFSIVDGDAYLPEAVKNVGSEGESAKRVRDFRERQRALQCNSDVTSGNDDVTDNKLPSNTEREERREDKSREEREGEREEGQDESCKNSCGKEQAKTNTLPSLPVSFNSTEEAEKKAFASEFVRAFNNFTSSNAKNINEVMGYTNTSSKGKENLEALKQVFSERQYVWQQCLEVAKKESQTKNGKIIKGKERFWYFRELLFYYLQNGNGKKDEIGKHYTKQELEKMAKVQAENKIAHEASLRLEEIETAIAKKIGITKQELESKACKIQMENGVRGIKIDYKTLLEKIEVGEIKL